jgi:XTP/dITP diphosphohydrolase
MSTAGPTLLLATSNPGKRAEFARLLLPSVRLLTFEDVHVTLPPEDGESFEQIASTKALVAASTTGFLALADDSGLEVDALDGAPGLRSARFAGETASDADNRAKLLASIRDVPADRRTARFRCAVALADPSRVVATAHGTCEGAVGFAERGVHGFGYDPIFVLPDDRTLAEVLPEEKNRISHRARAYAAILPALEAYFASRVTPGGRR